MIDTWLWACFLWGCGELDRGQTSHSTSSSIVLQTVPASLAKRQPEETFSTLLVFSVLFLLPFFFYSLSLPVIQSSSFFLFFHTISVPTPSPHPACLRHLSLFSLVFLSLSLLLEDTRCKQSSSQRHTLHTISLAFKGVEYSQLCWKLNSLKPPFPLQQFIVGEFSVFGERLGLSRGWCQRAPIVPCSTAVSPPLRLPSTFPSSPDIRFVTEKRKSGRCTSVSERFTSYFVTFSHFWVVYSVVREVQITVSVLQYWGWDKAMSTAATDYTYQSSFPAPSTWLHMPPLDDRTSCTGGK